MTSSHSIVPLSNNAIDSAQIYGGTGIANHEPVQISPIPALGATVGVAFQYDLSVHFDDPDGDALTFTGNAPAGLNIASNGILSGTPTATGTTTDNDVRATDPGGLFVESLFTMSIADAPAVSGRPPRDTNGYDIFNSSAWRDCFKPGVATPAAIAICKRAYGMVRQSGQHVLISGLQEIWDSMNPILAEAYPTSLWGEHMDISQMELEQPPNHSERKYNYNYVFQQGNNDALLTDSSGRHLGQQSAASLPWRVLSCRMTDVGFVGNFINRYLSDMNRSVTGGNPITLFPKMFQDGMPAHTRRKNCFWKHAGYISSIQGSRKVRLPAWTSAPTDGIPDAEGYEGLTDTYLIWWRSSEFNFTNSAFNDIKGYKDVGGGLGEFLLTRDMEGKVSSSWHGVVFKAAGDGKSADWTYPPDGIQDNMSAPSGGQLRREGLLDVLMQGVVDWYASFGTPHDCGPWANGASGESLTKRTEGTDYPNEYTDAFGIFQGEKVPYDAGFTIKKQVYQYNNFDVNRYASLVYNGNGNIAKTPFPDMASPHLMASTHIRDRSVYDADEVDAMMLRFHHTLTRMMPGGTISGVYTTCSLGYASRRPYVIEEMFISLGDHATGNPDYEFGTWDPTANSMKGLMTQRTPDFGEMGYVKQFPNALPYAVWMAANPRKTVNLNWIPPHLPGATVVIDPGKDRWTIPALGVGNGLWTFDPQTYICPETGEDPRSGIISEMAAGRDDILNAPAVGTAPQGCGVYLGTTGATIDIGYGCAQWFIEAPTP